MISTGEEGEGTSNQNDLDYSPGYPRFYMRNHAVVKMDISGVLVLDKFALILK